MDEDARYRGIVATIVIFIVGVALLSWLVPTISNSGTDDHSTQITTVTQDKKDGCISAAETWNNIGKYTCVVFYPQKFAQSGGYYFIDEKEDYTKGFVVFIGKKNIIPWSDFLARYKVGKKIKVTGTIELYKGYPQIKVYDLSRIQVMD